MSCITTEMIKYSQECEKKYHIPTSISLGQIVLESSGGYTGGLSRLAYEGKNLFGVKGSYNGQSVKMLTTEFQDGVPVKVYADFKKYPSYKESIYDHAKLLCTSRYTKYTSQATSIKDYCYAIKDGGYATDPNYPALLFNVIAQNHFEQYDIGDWELGGVTLDDYDNTTNESDTVDKEGEEMSLFQNITKVVMIFGIIILGVYLMLQGLKEVTK